MTNIRRNIQHGASFVRKNPQIIYTISLLIIIPAAFIFSGQQFLKATRDNQETLEKQRIGIMQDTFVSFAADRLTNQTFLQDRIDEIVNVNPTITEFTVVLRLPADNLLVVAALDSQKIGHLEEENLDIYALAGARKNETTSHEYFINGERHWNAVRAIKNADDVVVGFIQTDFSMASLDNVLRGRVNKSFLILLLIVVIIIILIFRHARIIDYTTLYRRLQEVDQMKDDFISIASHELRAPLTAIKWQIDVLSDEIKADKNIVAVLGHAGALEKLVEDMLDVSRIEQGRFKYDMKVLDPENLVKEVVSTFDATAKQKGLSISFEKKSSTNILVDSDRLSQVVTNLISNALKYTIKGSVCVELEADQKNVSVRVKDTGLGISSEDQKRLFQKFQRIKSDESKYVRGTGLGLWITKQIAEGMKGSIAVESIKGTGSSFIVSFPIST